MSARPFSHHVQQGSADCASPRQQVSRHAPSDRKATPSQLSASADSLGTLSSPKTPLNKQPAQLTLCDERASSYSTASPGRPDTAATSSVPAASGPRPPHIDGTTHTGAPSRTGLSVWLTTLCGFCQVFRRCSSSAHPCPVS